MPFGAEFVLRAPVVVVVPILILMVGVVSRVHGIHDIANGGDRHRGRDVLGRATVDDVHAGHKRGCA